MLLHHPLVPEAFLLFEQHVLDGLSAHRQCRDEEPEAGGVLLGFRRGAHLHVVGFTPPQARDIRTRYSFHRSARGYQELARWAWKESGGHVDYLGEWHTHPEAQPAPSGIDLREWRIICTRGSQKIFIIVGTVLNWVGVGCCEAIQAAESEVS
jgi:integrative and conjugative element protein (TIGR02256 family)